MSFPIVMPTPLWFKDKQGASADDTVPSAALQSARDAVKGSDTRQIWPHPLPSEKS